MPAAAVSAPAAASGGAKSACPPHVLEAIYGKVEDKKVAYEESLKRWWTGGWDSQVQAGARMVSSSAALALLPALLPPLLQSMQTARTTKPTSTWQTAC